MENPPKTMVLENTDVSEYSGRFTLGVTYYVMIMTRDNVGDFSNSQIIRFTP